MRLKLKVDCDPVSEITEALKEASDLSNKIGIQIEFDLGGVTYFVNPKPHPKTTHGMARHGGLQATEYTTWRHMKSRCQNPNNTYYKSYGGRGISICDRWLNSFENFFEDMGKKPSPKHSLDRIDNSGNYEPGNCKWSTKSEQSNNRRKTMISHNGVTKSINQWAKYIGVSTVAFRYRLAAWSIKDAIEIPPHKQQSNRMKKKNALIEETKKTA